MAGPTHCWLRVVSLKMNSLELEIHLLTYTCGMGGGVGGVQSGPPGLRARG